MPNLRRPLSSDQAEAVRLEERISIGNVPLEPLINCFAMFCSIDSGRGPHLWLKTRCPNVYLSTIIHFNGFEFLRRRG